MRLTTTMVGITTCFLICVVGGCSFTGLQLHLSLYQAPDTPSGQVAARSCLSKFPASQLEWDEFPGLLGCLNTIPNTQLSRRDTEYFSPPAGAPGCRMVSRWSATDEGRSLSSAVLYLCPQTSGPVGTAAQASATSYPDADPPRVAAVNRLGAEALALVDQKQYGAATAKYEEMAGTAEEIQNREDRLRWLENINWGIAAAIAHDTNRERCRFRDALPYADAALQATNDPGTSTSSPVKGRILRFEDLFWRPSADMMKRRRWQKPKLRLANQTLIWSRAYPPLGRNQLVFRQTRMAIIARRSKCSRKHRNDMGQNGRKQ